VIGERSGFGLFWTKSEWSDISLFIILYHSDS
jgi:hypothetical protein